MVCKVIWCIGEPLPGREVCKQHNDRPIKPVYDKHGNWRWESSEEYRDRLFAEDAPIRAQQRREAIASEPKPVGLFGA